MILEQEEWMEEYSPLLDPENNYDTPLDCDPRLSSNKISNEEFRKAVEENKVWTLVDGDGDSYNEYDEPIDHTTILAGFHLVNRLEHYITLKPWTDEDIEVI